MPITGFTIGRDVAIDINMPQGPVRFSNLTGFERRQMSTPIESKGLDVTDRFGTIPSGWQGKVDIDRADANMDIAFDYLETLYYSGQNVPPSSITETITEPNGSITQWRFVGVAWTFDEGGNYQGDAKVTYFEMAYYQREIICDEVLKDACKRAGLTGIRFGAVVDR